MLREIEYGTQDKGIEKSDNGVVGMSVVFLPQDAAASVVYQSMIRMHRCGKLRILAGQIRQHDHVLTPPRLRCAAAVEREPFKFFPMQTQ